MIRITGGELRGRVLRTPPHSNLRPSHARLRQALYNAIQDTIPGARVLDLFAGSGALGFEALSRGAVSVTFVEKDRPTAKLIEANTRDLGMTDRVRVINDSVDAALTRLVSKGAEFDLVLADPPYEAGWESKLVSTQVWEKLLAVDAVLCVEWGARKSQVSELPEQTPWLVKTREKIYGESVLTHFRKKV